MVSQGSDFRFRMRFPSCICLTARVSRGPFSSPLGFIVPVGISSFTENRPGSETRIRSSLPPHPVTRLRELVSIRVHDGQDSEFKGIQETVDVVVAFIAAGVTGCLVCRESSCNKHGCSRTYPFPGMMSAINPNHLLLWVRSDNKDF